MDPKDFLESARRLLSSATEEADFRTVISRAYYSVYHSIRIEIQKNLSVALIQQAGLGTKNLIAHDRLCAALRGCPLTRLLGDDLDSLRKYRQRADYELNDVILKREAGDVFADAEALFADMNSFGGVRKVAEALRAYLQQIHSGA